jgi:glycerophosphoryl diester phosphodiesterase
VNAPAPLVIAHRGASGYLPEHTLASKALAYGLGADFLEQDVVATRDDELIVLHDIHLDTVTDVALRFPDRRRSDGRWYARDFDLAEIRGLRVYERTAPDGAAPVYPGRFPHRYGHFGIPTLVDEIEMVIGLNRATGRRVGIYPEIKKPAWHHAEGVDVATKLLGILDAYGFRRRGDPVYLQCFDPTETRRLREDLGTELRIVQLIADDAWAEADTDFAAMLSADGLAKVAEYADAIGPWLRQLYSCEEGAAGPMATEVTDRAHDHGLVVHPYTFRADELPPGFDDYETLVRWFSETLTVDGLFTDFTDLTLRALGRQTGPE